MVPLMISNMAAGNVSIRLGLRGKCTNVATACASGTHCIGDAFRAIQYGDADIMVAGGAESAICSDTVWQDSRRLRRFLHQKIRLVHQDRLTKTEMDLSWEKEQALLFWKNWNMRRQRRKNIRRACQGTAATADAWHITSPAEDGEGAAMAMKLAMRGSRRTGRADRTILMLMETSTHHNDLFETRAIRSALGSAADQVVVNSNEIHDRSSSRSGRRS